MSHDHKNTKFFPRLHANRFFHFYEAPWQLLRVYGDATLLYFIYMFSPDNSDSVCLRILFFFCTLGALCAKISVLNNIHTGGVCCRVSRKTLKTSENCVVYFRFTVRRQVCASVVYISFLVSIAWYSVVLSIYSCSHAHPSPAQTTTFAAHDDRSRRNTKCKLRLFKSTFLQWSSRAIKTGHA